jgi:hypothetical protein
MAGSAPEKPSSGDKRGNSNQLHTKILVLLRSVDIFSYYMDMKPYPFP